MYVPPPLQLLIMELTFIDDRVSVEAARARGHMHIADFVANAHRFQVGGRRGETVTRGGYGGESARGHMHIANFVANAHRFQVG